MPIQRLSYEVTFLTPAFLGNAEQRGQWRTPPFKAAVRHWWRVVWACRNSHPAAIESMRLAEGRLLGAASDNGKSRSNVRLRLGRWSHGSDDGASWPRPRSADPLLYLGYGPLEHQKGKGTVLKHAAIQAGEKANFEIALPGDELDSIRDALALLHNYGTLGGRSRNGWGSVALDPSTSLSNLDVDLKRFQHDWRDALDHDWAHAIGCDDRALIWTTKPYRSWDRLMATLAEVRGSVRRQFTFAPSRGPQERHWLAYPVTKHEVNDWHSKRLPNSLRLKVRRDSQNPNQLQGVIFHMPCLPPKDFNPRRNDVERVWQNVHAFLDNRTDLDRARE